jgi:hypothetical protein
LSPTFSSFCSLGVTVQIGRAEVHHQHEVLVRVGEVQVAAGACLRHSRHELNALQTADLLDIRDRQSVICASGLLSGCGGESGGRRQREQQQRGE